jgi:hypothetical protein
MFKFIRHYLALFFVIALVMTQALVFVVSKASQNYNQDYKLSAVFVEPLIGYSLAIGQPVNLQARLSTQDTNKFSTVYFTVANEEQNLKINFEADLQADGTWLASSAWQKTDLPTAWYSLSATASVYNQDGSVANTFQSAPQFIYLTKIVVVNNYQASVATSDEPGGMGQVTKPTSGQVITNGVLEAEVGLLINKASDAKLEYDVFFSILKTGELAPIFKKQASSISPETVNTYLYGVIFNELSNLTNGQYTLLAERVATGLAIIDFIGYEPTYSVIIGTVPFTIANASTSVTPPASSSVIDIISPKDGETYSNNIEIKIKSNSVEITSAIVNFSSSIGSTGPSIQRKYIYFLGPTTIGNDRFFVSQTGIDPSDVETNGQLKFPEGNYSIIFYNKAGNTVGTSNFKIAKAGPNDSEIKKEPVDVIATQQIFVNKPLEGTIISSNTLSLDIRTTNPIFNVVVNLTKADNQAIGTGDIKIAYVDGFSWVKNIELNDSLVDGEYFLNIISLVSPTSLTGGTEADVKLTLARGTKIIAIPKPEDVVLLWHNVNQNLTKGDLLFASANVRAISFILKDTKPIPTEISSILDTQEIDCASLTDATIKQEVIDSKNPYCFYAFLGQEVLTGNYHLSLTTTKAPIVKKDLGLVAIYNEEVAENIKEPENNATSTEAVDLPEVKDISQPEISCVEVGIKTPQNCLIFKALETSLNETCLQQGIYEVKACEDYLNTLKVDQECQTASILDLEKCKDYLLEKYGSQVECRLTDTQLCQDLLRNTFLNRLVVGSQEQDIIKEVADPLIGQVLSISKLGEELTNRGLINQILPLPTNSETKVFISKSQKETVLESADKLTIINNAALIIDSDADGLVDDLEAYYGTDPLNPDSDSDGYSDGTEVKNGYNPLGEGKLEKAGTILGEIIASESILEQPKELSEKIDSQFVINQFLNKEDGAITLNGSAEANSWVILYLYSDLPLVMTTKTDASGNWSYDIKQSLTDGHHRVYVSLNDNTGQIVKQSSAFSLLVKKARAATPAEYFDESTTPNKVNNMMIYYLFGAGVLVIMGLIFIILLNIRKHKKIEF